MGLTKIVSYEFAVANCIPASEIEAVAAWHDEIVETRPGLTITERDRHDVTAFRLWRLAHRLRASRAISAAES